MSFRGFCQLDQNLEVCPYCGGYLYTRYILVSDLISVSNMRDHTTLKKEEERKVMLQTLNEIHN